MSPLPIQPLDQIEVARLEKANHQAFVSTMERIIPNVIQITRMLTTIAIVSHEFGIDKLP